MFINWEGARTVEVGENCAKLESRLEGSATFCGLSGSGPVVDAVSGTGEVAGGSSERETNSLRIRTECFDLMTLRPVDCNELL